MRVPWIQSLVILSALGLGCSIVRNTKRNVHEFPSDRVDDCLTDCAQKREADAAWDSYKNACPGNSFSAAYEYGFKEGFVDFIQHGGNGMPPTLAPWRFRHLRNENPEGFAEIRDYDAGFIAGSNAARETGLREFFIVPSAARLLGATPVGPLPSPAAPKADVEPEPTTLPPPKLETPPAPRPTASSRNRGDADMQRTAADWVR